MENKLETVSVETAASMLGISRTTAYLSIKNGSLPACIFGVKRIRVPLRVIERLLESGTTIRQQEATQAKVN